MFIQYTFSVLNKFILNEFGILKNIKNETKQLM